MYCARWGAGGALSLQSAIVGSKDRPRCIAWEAVAEQVMMIPRSCAMIHREPCQDGNIAALSGAYHVPQGGFGGVNCQKNVSA